MGTVWHVIGDMRPDKGGTTATAAALARSIAARNIQVRLLTGAPATQLEAVGELWRDLGRDGVSFHAFAARHGPKPCVSRGLVAFLGDGIRTGDVLHLHGVWEGLLWDAARAAHRRGVPYVVFPHGMLGRWSLRRSAWKKKIALALGARRMLERAAAIQCLTEEDRADAARLGLPARLEIIPNAVGSRDLLQRPASRSGEPFTVLFLSRIHPKKGLDILIEAFGRADLANAVLVVAGPSSDTVYERRCREIAIAFGVAHRVRWTGPLYGAAKTSLLLQSDVFVLPSHEEGFSLAVLEAMAAGLPVIISDQCRFPAVRASDAGLVVANRPCELSAAIAELAQQEDGARQAMGLRGQALVAEQFLWERITARLLSLYRELGAAL